MLERTAKQTRFATAVALTRTAGHVRKAVTEEMAKQFDRPTPMVMRSLYTSPAKRDNLVAMVYLKDRPLPGQARSMSELLAHQFSGGSRIAKQVEVVLRQAGLMGSGEYLVPGAAAKLDRYGNWARGQIVQVLSQLKIGGGTGRGYDNAPTGSKRSKRNVARAGVFFYSGGPEGRAGRTLVDRETGITYGRETRTRSHLPKGVWMRTDSGPKPIALFIRGAPTYKRRIDMRAIADRVIAARFNAEFSTALAQANATARA